MTAATTSSPGARTSRADSLRRTMLLGRVNWTLMLRNRTTMLYAFLMPALPLVLLVVATRDGANVDPSAGVLSSALVLALVFPGYYNLLSMFVTRRDELVLKRLRTGEIRDSELVTSMALPGAAITLAITVISVVVAAAVGLDLPRDPVLLLLTVVLAVVTFAAFAVWTAAWTKTAESAQLTSGPIIILAMLGFTRAYFPESWQPLVDLTPGAAVDTLLRASWFAQEGPGGATDLSYVEAWVYAAPSLAALVGWTALAVVLAKRSMRWEPRD
jgi:ABC-2 type transport system permease protein